ncbi:MAG: hypothetical protein ABJF11_12355 [Reichenbachiella sp.]|uniref:hypothetical protein n=1 Tax=Reichenbachiella sp. TaxID=2184521 RepID=UPI0032662B41
MNIRLIFKLKSLLTEPSTEQVDHIKMLNDLYSEHSSDNDALNPLFQYLFNGIDDLPQLEQKVNWNLDNYNKSRIPFTESFSELKAIIESILNNTNAEHLIELYNSIDEILWNDWDPIGVKGIEPEDARDEYEDYVLSTFQLLIENPDSSQLNDHLHRIEIETIGVLGNDNDRSIVVSKLLALQK